MPLSTRGLIPFLAAACLASGAAHADPALPQVQLGATPAMLTEGDLLTFEFKLSKPAPAEGLDVRMTLLRDTDPLPGDADYFVDGSVNIAGFRFVRNDDGTVSDAVVSITPGARSAKLVAKTLADEVAEVEEHAVYALANNNAYDIDERRNAADFTISDRPVVGVDLVTQMPVREGRQMAFHFKLSRPAPTGGLPVRLALVRDSDPQPGDIQYFVAGSRNIADNQVVIENGTIYHLLVTIAEGATTATLLSDVIADGVAEGPEYALFKIAAGQAYSIDPEHDGVRLKLVDR
ncbi:MAG: hypothetical protein EPN21_10990 [Methylococcaceae bacterium]|nr:MAG: hypothetical protein EPN21_10990 [Methylococcaceae bacterium]